MAAAETRTPGAFSFGGMYRTPSTGRSGPLAATSSTLSGVPPPAPGGPPPRPPRRRLPAAAAVGTGIAVSGRGALRSGGGFGLNGDGREVFRGQGIFGHGLPNPAALTLGPGGNGWHSTTKASEKRSRRSKTRSQSPKTRPAGRCSGEQAQNPLGRSGLDPGQAEVLGGVLGRRKRQPGRWSFPARSGKTAGPSGRTFRGSGKHSTISSSRSPRERPWRREADPNAARPRDRAASRAGRRPSSTSWDRYATPCAIARLTGSCTAAKVMAVTRDFSGQGAHVGHRQVLRMLRRDAQAVPGRQSPGGDLPFRAASSSVSIARVSLLRNASRSTAASCVSMLCR